MPDDLHIPPSMGATPVRSSYRAQPQGMDGGTRILVIAAAALGGLLLAGMGGWALLGHRGGPVPVIEADTRPLRVKPENAGGLQVAGADEQVMGDQAAGRQGMAPAPEIPAPQALRAQQQAAAPAPQAPPAPAQSAAVPAAAAPNAPARAAVPGRPAAHAPAVAAVPAAPARTAGGTLVQLAAVDTEAAALAEWQRLAKRMPDLLGDRKPVVQKVERDSRVIWRVRTGGFADIADATGFCAKVRGKGGSCSIASF